ncbi:3-deoxy-manno-octulosonate cytidylyltransferase [Desulfurispirillum indicum]|uniref:3-deoxy-manno-octulosonate cytidylyltransferase n=1 Tax=Desulfurispirillum indicum TaxID=936456 RepID=UPI001CFB1308|nr:3-deoxy-manno-octulosonate cytidylyltransferase [Desulfurispirillum indicum]UCZ56874.1 3-deoxy-manno-octulosonate cytidylyltransferase [Desulfurispirillum indicum]
MSTPQPTIRVVIPARYASMRLPAKPLVDLAGLPMIVRVFQRVQLGLPGEDILVATDDERIVQVLARHDIPHVLTAADHQSGTDRAAEVARLSGWSDDDIILNVQGDEPLVPCELLRAFADFCQQQTALQMGTIVVPVTEYQHIHDPNVVKVVLNQQQDALLFSRAPIPHCRDISPEQWPLEAFARHIGIYAYRNRVLQQLATTPPCALELREKLEQLRALWLGIPIRVMAWHESPPHGVDTPADVQRVIRILQQQKDTP